MPYIGEIRDAKEIGLLKKRCKVVWLACLDCGKERWVRLNNSKERRGIPRSQRCKHCANFKETSGMWKGGRSRKNDGYMRVRLYPDDFFFPMANKDLYVLEHRLLMAKSLNRCLLPWEVVHHKNGDKGDNRLENLVLLPEQSKHLPDVVARRVIKAQQVEIDKLKARITELENESMRWSSVRYSARR